MGHGEETLTLFLLERAPVHELPAAVRQSAAYLGGWGGREETLQSKQMVGSPFYLTGFFSCVKSSNMIKKDPLHLFL